MDVEIRKNRTTKILQWTNIALAIGLGVCVYFDKSILGVGLFFTPMGLILILGAFLDTGTLVFTMGGLYDYIKNPVYRQYYARFINLFWGLVISLFGVAALIKTFG
jgi:hypothetical protein